MKKFSKKIYMVGGYNTISLGTGRKEFNPKKERPGLLEYIQEAGRGTLAKIGGAAVVDESVISNFMAARYNNQGHLAGFIPAIDAGLKFKPVVRVEAACGSGGLGLATSIKTVLAGSAEVVLALGVEVQNTVKAVYGADILAGAGYFKERKTGHAHFFPGKFSDRAGIYYAKYGREKTRKAMAVWFKNAIENARLDPTAQEHHNTSANPEAVASVEPNAKSFLEHITVFDCSKVSDGAAAIAIVSEEGLKRTGIALKDAVEIVGLGQAEYDITTPPEDMTALETTAVAVKKAIEMAGITIDDLSTVECHDCFSIAGIMATEAIGFAKPGEGPDFVLAGNTSRQGKIPFNTTGGLCGWGHPVGATGVHQAVTIWMQLTGHAGNSQIKISEDRPYALSVNMGGDDKTVIAIVYKKCN
ncbi:MAG: 3-ketoacyl-CoA thiolase [Bacteroidota bacterium]